MCTWILCGCKFHSCILLGKVKAKLLDGGGLREGAAKGTLVSEMPPRTSENRDLKVPEPHRLTSYEPTDMMTSFNFFFKGARFYAKTAFLDF